MKIAGQNRILPPLREFIENLLKFTPIWELKFNRQILGFWW